MFQKSEHTAEPSVKKRLIIGGSVLVAAIIITVVIALLVKAGIEDPTPPATGDPVTLPPTSGQTTTPKDGSTTPEDPVTDTATTPPVVEPPLLQQREGVYTILVSGHGEAGEQPDAIAVITFDSTAKTINCLNIPRDVYSALWEESGRREIFSHISLAYSHHNRAVFKKEVEALVGFGINHYVEVKMAAFVRIINKIGGIYYNIPFDMNYHDPTQDLHIQFTAGSQYLNGKQALEYLRYRDERTGYDIGRINRRNAFLTEVFRQVLSNSNLKITEIVGEVMDNVTTNMTYNDLLWYATEALKMNAASIHFYTVPGTPNLENTTTPDGRYYPYRNALLDIINKHMNPYNLDIETIQVVERSFTAGK